MLCVIFIHSFPYSWTRKPKSINPLNTKLNPISHLLALLGAHHILRVSRVRVNSSPERSQNYKFGFQKKTDTNCPKRVLSNFRPSYGIQSVLTCNLCPTSDHNDRASRVFFASWGQIQEHKLSPHRPWIHGKEMEVYLHWVLTSALEGHTPLRKVLR